MSDANPLYIWIYSFHMPVFFIVCGILLSIKEKQQPNLRNMGKGILKRVVSLGVPYLFFGLVMTAFYAVLNIIGHQPVTVGVNLFRLFTLQGIDSMWFIPVYFFADVFMSLLGAVDRFNGIVRLLVTLMLTVILFCVAGCSFDAFITVIFKIMIGMTFVEIGIIVNRVCLIEKIPTIGIVVCFAVGLMCALFNGPVEMTTTKMNHPLAYYLAAIFTSVTVLGLFKKSEKYKIRVLDIIEYYGKNSIVLLCTNNLIIEIVRLADYKLFGNILIHWGICGSIVFTIIILIVEDVLIKLANGPFSFLFGKRMKIGQKRR